MRCPASLSGGQRPRPAARPALAVAVLGILLTACSSNAASTTTTSTAATTTSSTATTTSSTSAPPSSTLPVTTADRRGISTAYMTLFDLANPAIAPKLAAVQDGSGLKAAFSAALKSALAKEAGGARVLAITLEGKTSCSAESLSSPCALVTYDVVSPAKQTLLKNEKGYAVNSSGRWLVAKKTICNLLVLASGGTAPPGC
jgi:hypothetical protein